MPQRFDERYGKDPKAKVEETPVEDQEEEFDEEFEDDEPSED